MANLSNSGYDGMEDYLNDLAAGQFVEAQPLIYDRLTENFVDCKCGQRNPDSSDTCCWCEEPLPQKSG